MENATAFRTGELLPEFPVLDDYGHSSLCLHQLRGDTIDCGIGNEVHGDFSAAFECESDVVRIDADLLNGGADDAVERNYEGFFRRLDVQAFH